MKISLVLKIAKETKLSFGAFQSRKSLKYLDFWRLSCGNALFIRQLQRLSIDRHRSNLNYFAGAHVATPWSINGRLKVRFGPRHGSSISTSIFLEDLVRIGRVFTVGFNRGSIRTRSLTSISKFSLVLLFSAVLSSSFQ